MEIQDFINAGFRVYQAPASNKHAIGSLQKWIDNKFCLSILPYDLGELTEGKVEGLVLEAECQFEQDGKTFNVNLLRVESPEQAIEFMQNVFHKLNCKPQG